MQPVSIYIHWPFCKAKCPYCDFNSHVRNQIDHDIWLKAYLTEIDYYKEYLNNKKITSIFFGGGTPSLMQASTIDAILNKISHFTLSDTLEITLEANPTSIEAARFKDFARIGINRVSIGIQALNDIDLKFLGRTHSAKNAINAIEIAKENFTNYSFDLIYARPNQTLKQWEQELLSALKLTAKHLSLYQLTIEKGTSFYRAYHNNEFKLPDEDLASNLYNLTNDIVENHGLKCYEISNYAVPGFESIHNLSYWNYQDYLGIGPGAHGRINNQAQMMIHHPENWLKQVLEKKVGLQQQNELSLTEQIEEFLLMGLRLTSGVNIKLMEQRFQKSFKELINPAQLEAMIKYGLVKLDDNIYATKKGRLLLNQIIANLVK
jgi:oxygen-independent coproporphyrinogen-3 oxidase